MPVIVACRSCSRKLRVTDDLLGHKVKCPSCGQAFDAEEQPPDPPKEEYPASRENGTPITGEGRLAPDREEYDDRPWEEPPRMQVRRDCEPERGTLVLTMGIISLVLPVLGIVLGIAAWVMGSKDLKKMRKGQMDPQGQGTTQAGLICGIVGLVMQSLFTLGCVMYIMLIAVVVTAARTPMRVAPVPVAPATKTVPAGEIIEMNEEGEVLDPNQPVPAPKAPRPRRGK